MRKRIFIALALTPLALVISGFFIAQLENQNVDLPSVVTGCGVTALGGDCLYDCHVERVQCNLTCLPLPDDCPSGPECQQYIACKNACHSEYRNCINNCQGR